MDTTAFLIGALTASAALGVIMWAFWRDTRGRDRAAARLLPTLAELAPVVTALMRSIRLDNLNPLYDLKARLANHLDTDARLARDLVNRDQLLASLDEMGSLLTMWVEQQHRRELDAVTRDQYMTLERERAEGEARLQIVLKYLEVEAAARERERGREGEERAFQREAYFRGVEAQDKIRQAVVASVAELRNNPVLRDEVPKIFQEIEASLRSMRPDEPVNQEMIDQLGNDLVNRAVKRLLGPT